MIEKKTNVTFAQRLKDLRIEKELSQGELADKLGISRASIINYENGERVPDILFAEKIANFFDISVDFLIGRIDYRIEDKEIEIACDKLGISPNVASLFGMKKMEEPHNLETLNMMLDWWNDLHISQILYWTRKHTAFKAQDMISEKLWFFRFCKDEQIEIIEEDKDLTLEELEEQYLTKKKQRNDWQECLNRNRALNNDIDNYNNKEYCEFAIQSSLHNLVDDVSNEYIENYKLTNIDNLNKFYREQCVPSEESDAECMNEPECNNGEGKYPDLQDMFVITENKE